ncbi:PIG-L deacetylase family protein [Moorella sulfitireducens]|uniref:PIG-L deacetylase family protein n=1 Tax=Neomoorella sulfitireducens TaxID=2972948 RepID=UPI0021AC85BD|nr:PIG-L family deacetylase [Moorella sulfitireducens]
MKNKHSIMGIGAHPDDLEIACGGTLALYARQGHRITMCHVCNGDKGHFELRPEELARIRLAEARSAAGMIGAGVIALGVPDGEAGVDYTGQRIKMVEAIREAKPDIIITHAPRDYHPDHVAVHRLVLDASFLATVPHIETGQQALNRVPEIYFMDTYAGVNFVPTDYVDITSTLEIKLAMMECHQSQVKWLKDHDSFDVLEFIRVSGRYRGFQCGCSYAEGFRKHLAALYLGPKRL